MSKIVTIGDFKLDCPGRVEITDPAELAKMRLSSQAFAEIERLEQAQALVPRLIRGQLVRGCTP